MSPRDTGTGRVLEEMILPSLRRGGYTYPQGPQKIGPRFGGGAHYVDVIAEKDGQRCLVSLKWQQVAGTAEQKVPFEVIVLPMPCSPVNSPKHIWCSAAKVGSFATSIPVVAYEISLSTLIRWTFSRLKVSLPRRTKGGCRHHQRM